MAHHEEPLDGGLVTIRDPAFLKPGQLSALQNAIYYPGSPALQRALGRVAFGTVSATAQDVVGLRDVQFDSGDNILIAHASSSYLTAAVGDTGTFGSLSAAVGVGSQLEVVHYRNRFFLMNGVSLNASATAVNSNWVIYQSATAAGTVPILRQHGMRPVISAPTTASSATAFSQTVTGYYEYWTTEVAIYTQDGAELPVESTFSNSVPVTVFQSATGFAPIIIRPDQKNAAATHWRVYRSVLKQSQNAKAFPSGFQISPDISIAATSMIDSAVVSNTGFVFPASMNGVGGDGATMFIDMANAIRVSADDNSDGTIVGGLALDKGQGVYGFNFGGFSGPVQGIEVKIEALVSAGTTPVAITLVRKRQVDGGIIPSNLKDLPVDTFGKQYKKENTVAKSFMATTVRTVYTLGGSNDRWFPSDASQPFRDSDFSTNFMLIVGSPFNNVTLSVDYVQVKVYYGGSIDSVSPFPTVVYTFGDVSAQVGKNGPPTSASTGDVYEDSLVTNDVDSPAVLRWSYPGGTDAFPSTYYIDFETRENDRITLIKVVNDRLVVGLRTSLWRVNYLPSERDASFDRGKAKQAITRSYGIVNPMCACTFSRDGGSEELAFISDKGLHSTDGFSFNTRSANLQWRNIISLTSTSVPIALINDPENECLRFYYQNNGNGNETYLELRFSYGAGNIDEEGNFKVSGPVNMRNFDTGTSGRADLKSAWALRRSNGNTGIYWGYGGASIAAGAGKVYIESGTTIPAEDSSMRYTTRRMYLNGWGGEWKLNEMYGYTGSYTGTPSLSYTALTTKTDDGGEVTKSTKTLTLAGQKLHRSDFALIAEGLRLSAIVTASAYAQELLVLDGDDFGDEDSGR